jgi:exodeoxyribonuclease VII large subunit
MSKTHQATNDLFSEPLSLAIPGEPPQPSKAFSVAEVVLRIKALIEREFLKAIWVEGELSNTSYASSGHIYFSLVDEKATDRYGQRLILPCAFFKGANQGLKFKLTDGLKVLCLGQVGTYEGRGNYQLRVLRVEPKGIGALQLAFEQLKKKLQAEGLFDEARKRPIPKFPNRICVITSPTGSAIHDMVSKLRGRFEITIIPAKVQGEGAADEISNAIKEANRLRLADVLIVGRGGGSVEDLWAFNEEVLARSIAASIIPVISAVGHQDDWTIADYVADFRASTPTDAAKFLVNEQQLLIDEANNLIQQLLDSVNQVIDEEQNRVESLSEQLRLLHPLNQLNEYINLTRQRQVELIRLMEHSLSNDEQNIQSLVGRLQALSPLSVLARGYSITFARPGRRVLTDASSVNSGDEIETQLAEGKIISQVIGTIKN